MHTGGKRYLAGPASGVTPQSRPAPTRNPADATLPPATNPIRCLVSCPYRNRKRTDTEYCLHIEKTRDRQKTTSKTLSTERTEAKTSLGAGAATQPSTPQVSTSLRRRLCGGAKGLKKIRAFSRISACGGIIVGHARR